MCIFVKSQAHAYPPSLWLPTWWSSVQAQPDRGNSLGMIEGSRNQQPTLQPTITASITGSRPQKKKKAKKKRQGKQRDRGPYYPFFHFIIPLHFTSWKPWFDIHFFRSSHYPFFFFFYFFVCQINVLVIALISFPSGPCFLTCLIPRVWSCSKSTYISSLRCCNSFKIYQTISIGSGFWPNYSLPYPPWPIYRCICLNIDMLGPCHWGFAAWQAYINVCYGHVLCCWIS